MQRILFSLIVGFLLGLIVAACVSFYINNAKVPFVDRFDEREAVTVPPNWDPNAALQQGSGTITNSPPPLLSGNTTNTTNVTPDTNPTTNTTGGYNNGLPAPATPPTTQPTANAQFYVQAGAFTSVQDAEQQRARLALIGTQATISPVSVAGQTLHRVRIGPYNTRAEAQAAIQRLAGNGIDSAIIGS